MPIINNITKKLAVVALTAVILLMQESLVLYRHAHQLPDGTVVWHSHPFGDSQNSSGGKTHQHAPGNQSALDLAASCVPLTGKVVLVSQLKPQLGQGYYLSNNQTNYQTRHGVSQLRAPPANV
ncbi:MAG: hypothetical protein PHQ65_08870 [Bacteroidales bacterium]|nr:hypothetical protein [Bacteroidales bacterium]MDD3665363.1 hypothetical protein [Bacteroidales bacterium]